MHNDTIVIFDDYWGVDDGGCKAVVERIDKLKYLARVLKIQDKFKRKWGILTINFVKVIIKHNNQIK